MDPQDQTNRYYPGVAHIPYNNRNAAFLKEMMLREDAAHEAWRTNTHYAHPRRPTIDVGLHAQPTAKLLEHDCGPTDGDVAKSSVGALKTYERELKARIAAERGAREEARRAKSELVKGKGTSFVSQ
jgi:hypothetical protein